MMNGAAFLDMLLQLGHPEVSSLNSSEFDGMFDGSPESKEFVHFLHGLSSQNVLKDEEYHAYRTLEVLGKPILTEQVLNQLDLTKNSPEPEEDDDLSAHSLEQLQQEQEKLCRHQRLRQRRLQQLQSLRCVHNEQPWGLGDYAQLQSPRLEGEAGNIHKAVARENVATNEALQDLRGEVKQLQNLMLLEDDVAEEEQQEWHRLMIEQHGRYAAALLSQLPLSPSLQKTQTTHQCVMDLYKGKSSLLEKQQAMSGGSKGNGDKLDVREELEDLRAAHMLIQGQLLQARAEWAGTKASKEWLQEQWMAGQVLTGLECDGDGSDVGPPVELKDSINSALWQRCMQLCSDVVRGHTTEQQAQVQKQAKLQETLLQELHQQKAQLDLLLFALQEEHQNHTHSTKHASGIVQDLKQESLHVTDRAREMQQLRKSTPKQESALGPAEPIVKRLLQVCKSPSKTEGCFVGMNDIHTVSLECRAELERLSLSEREAQAEQLEQLTTLENDSTWLKQWVEAQQCSGTDPSPNSQLCPSAQNLAQAVSDLEQHSGTLYWQLKEVMAERASKCSELKRSASLRRERELYALFHLDAKALGQVVEDMERHE